MSKSSRVAKHSNVDEMLRRYKKLSKKREKHFRRMLEKKADNQEWINKTKKSLNKLKKLKKSGDISFTKEYADFDINAMEVDDEKNEEKRNDKEDDASPAELPPQIAVEEGFSLFLLFLICFVIYFLPFF